MEYAILHRDLLVGLAALTCFQKAMYWTPYDARAYNNMGIALGKFMVIDNPSMQQQLREKVYRRGWDLLRRYDSSGCDLAHDFDLLSLNFGLYLAWNDRFAEGQDVLLQTAAKKSS